jgi:hypothetical protein
MQDFQPMAKAVSRVRRVAAPIFAVAALALSTQAALAVSGLQPKPQLNVEAERTPQGAKLTFKGKNWGANARVKITATRAPGSNNAQDFGMFTADSAGVLNGRKVAACSTTRSEDGQNESVTFTAADSATGVKATARVEGGAWVCQ